MSTDFTISNHNLDLSGDTTVTLEAPADPFDFNVTLKGNKDQPINTNSVIALEAPEEPFGFHFDWTEKPLKTESDLTLDVQPVVLDLCVDVNIGKLPPTRIRQPIDTHVGFTVLGIEFFGFNIVGESQIIVDEYRTPPKVVWGGEEQRIAPKDKKRRTYRKAGGLRIRLKD